MTHQHANTKELRREFRVSKPAKIPVNPLIMACLAFILLLVMAGACFADNARITDSSAIDACIGEAEGETYLGKVMLLYTLKNRGTLKGVYGVKAPRVIKRQYAQVTYNQCAKAWAFVKTHPNPDWKGTGWGNEADIREFRRHKWFKNCVIIAHVGKHFFYMENRG